MCGCHMTTHTDITTAQTSGTTPSPLSPSMLSPGVLCNVQSSLTATTAEVQIFPKGQSTAILGKHAPTYTTVQCTYARMSVCECNFQNRCSWLSMTVYIYNCVQPCTAYTNSTSFSSFSNVLSFSVSLSFFLVLV
jgi:hypothetical protein